MTSNISNVSCKFPIPDCFYEKDEMSLAELKAAIQKTFDCCETARNNIRKQLNAIYGKEGDISSKDLDAKGHVIFSNFIETICDDCDESNSAYKFYGKQIIDQINTLTDYINEAKLILSKWDDAVNSNTSVYSDVVRLECLHQFCSEIKTKFGTRYYYDFDEDNWKLAVDDYCGGSCSCCEVVDGTVKTTSGESFYTQIKNKYDSKTNKDGYKSLEDLYNTKVKADSGNNVSYQKVLECFNELNLLDRLKYIKVYYDIKSGKTNYVFPDDKEHGFPCVNEVDLLKTDARIANLEKFYVGYLIDRDGPVNAFCSLFEIKIDALQASINEMSKRIKAMNVYLDFINRGMEVLTQSQSNGKKGIPYGVVAVLIYLCGRNMYNLYEAKDGNKYLVIQSVRFSKPILIKTDESGKNFLIGDSDHSAFGDISETSLCMRYEWIINSASSYTTSSSLWDHYFYAEKTNNGYEVRHEKISDFQYKFPKQLDISTILPGSVKNFDNKSSYRKVLDKDNEHTAMIESWMNAFEKKIEYINDAIKLVNTDIEQYRNKINTYYSQSSTFRSRVEEVYSNSARKIL